MNFGTQSDAINDNGSMVTAGFQISDQPCAMVFPLVLTAGTVTAEMQSDAAAAAIFQWLTTSGNILTYLSNACYLAYIEAVGMTDGDVPARYEYAPTAYPGLVSGNAVPQQVAALMTGYQAASGTFGLRTKRCHQYIPGLPSAVWTEEILGGPTQAALLTAFNTLIFAGFTETTYSTTWKRYLAQPYTIVSGHKTRPSGLDVPKIGAFDVRSYAATQRRRLTPRY